MALTKTKRYIILGVLFFLPVTFLLFLYPATHHYTPLDIVGENVVELQNVSSTTDEDISLNEHITVLGFLGNNPMDKFISASNLKELVYDKFKGFKKFQIVIVSPEGTEKNIEKLQKEISSYEDLKFWHFVFAEPKQINKIFNSLNSETSLNKDLSSDYVYVIDKERNQRGRLDDRTDNEIEKKKPIYGLMAYNCIEVAEIKNKMSDDLRVLFTEYRQKRKGDFNSTIRRANDLNQTNE